MFCFGSCHFGTSDVFFSVFVTEADLGSLDTSGMKIFPTVVNGFQKSKYK